MSTQPTFDDLPEFDARKFQPPEWAKTQFHWGEKNGETSKAGSLNGASNRDTTQSHTADKGVVDPDGDDDQEEEEEEDEIWEDAVDIVEPDEAKFSTEDLNELLTKAIRLKNEGNALFTFKPIPKYDEAISTYLKAIDHLPHIPSPPEEDESVNPKKGGNKSGESGIEEVTEEEAIKIEQEELKKATSDQEKQREQVENGIKECTKNVWGNLAACYLALKKDKEAVEACTEALKIDPNYVKGLHRRATANERIGELSALVSAKDDYTLLQNLLPPSSPLNPSIRRSLTNLPERIKVEEKKQMDEMMGKLKDLGNSLLGNFGLSTDNFKFEKQDNGGWGMNFQR
ncbi:uncharacterized protein IL334_000784 [Kwoniella shivajii]|uniref:Tetratricopeptide repeat protein 1 n=1 Tax=Kwoniella shivajii TaxID=564305 RepID=A0ABZ1CRM7_9TREE|nr:hypothetical protein IL334_000784 [Kwoniella shivajii]